MMSQLIRDKRNLFFTNQEKIDYTYEIFPGMKNGPLGSKKTENCYNYGIKYKDELVKQCRHAMKSGKVVLEEDELLNALKIEVKLNGLPLHLLPEMTFASIREITCLKGTTKDSVSKVIDTLCSENLVIKIFTEKDMSTMFSDEEDPLKEHCSDKYWAKYFMMKEDLHQHGKCAGIYVIPEALCINKVNELKRCLRSYEPITPKDWFTCNAIMRLRAAAVKHFKYIIERNSTIFTRIPRNFCFSVNGVLNSHNGRKSLNGIISKLKDIYQEEIQDKTSEYHTIAALLQHVSDKNKEDLEISDSTPWIFAYNRDPGDQNHSLPISALEFNEKNLGKHVFRGLSAFLKKYNEKDFSNNEFIKKCIVGYPYSCGFRSKENIEYSCPYRFRSLRERGLHIKDHHKITHDELETISTYHKQWDSEVVDEYGWAESKRLLDLHNLRQRNDLCDLLSEWCEIHYRNWGLVTELENLIARLKERHSECNEVKEEQARNDAFLKICIEHLKYIEGMMMKAEDLERYLQAWLQNIQLQASVLTEINDLNDRMRQRQVLAARVAGIFTGDLKMELQRAGHVNLAAVRQESVMQSLGEHCQQTSTVTLAAITSLHRYDEQAAKNDVNIYKRTMKDHGLERPLKRKSCETDYEISKRIRHNDDHGKPSCSLIDIMTTSPVPATVLPKEIELDVIPPQCLMVSMIDYPELLIYTLEKLKKEKDDCMDDFVFTIARVFANTANAMFVFTDEGYSLVYQAFCFSLKSLRNEKDTVILRRHCWLVFCKGVEYINQNASGKLSFIFRVRLAHYGDQRMRPLQFAETSIIYKKSEINVIDITKGIAELDEQHLSLTTETSHLHVNKCRFMETHTELFRQLNQCRELQNKVHMNEDCKRETEINTYQKEQCQICLEPFSTRPIEGFNCSYKEAEGEFLRTKGYDGTSYLVDNGEMTTEFNAFVTEKIDKAKPVSYVDHSTGMHLFHKDCIRRFIQMKALDSMCESICCPICRKVIYNSREKDTILFNIYDAACNLMIGLQEDVKTLQSDEIINLKNRGNSDANISILTDYSSIKSATFSDKGKNSQMDVDIPHNEKMVLLEKYIEMTTGNNPDDIIMKNKSPMDMYKNYMEEPKNFSKAQMILYKVESNTSVS